MERLSKKLNGKEFGAWNSAEERKAWFDRLEALNAVEDATRKRAEGEEEWIRSMYAARHAGLSLAAIARVAGVTRARVQQITSLPLMDANSKNPLEASIARLRSED